MSAPAGAATGTIADWEMNEPNGATVLVDSSGHGFDGQIGAAVTPNGSSHFFDLRKHNGVPPAPEHLDVVPNKTGLSPGTGNYVITLRLKWTAPLVDVNLIQKGQGAARGWKIESSGGWVRCQFLGTDGNATIKSIDFPSQWSRPGADTRDWHTVTCARIGKTVSLSIDNHLIASKTHATGNITNTWPISIAGKTKCDNVQVTCDYWSGSIDYIRITTS
jgi:hypothetical protein